MADNLEEYWNLVPRPRFSYYFNANMYNGILIDIDSDVLVVNRSIYSFVNWLQEVGGFSKTVGVFIAFLFPFFSMSSIESFLILNMFKQSPKMRVDTSEFKENSVKRLLTMSK